MRIVKFLYLLLSCHGQLIFEKPSHIPVTYVFLRTLPNLDDNHCLVVGSIH